MSNRMEQEFSAFWERRAKDFPGITQNVAAVIFYCGAEAGVYIAHQVREEMSKAVAADALQRSCERHARAVKSEHGIGNCPHGYAYDDLRTGATTCEACLK